MFTRRVLPVLAGAAAAGAASTAVLIIGQLAGVRLLPMVVAAPVAAALVLPCFIAVVMILSLLPNGRAQLRPMVGHLPVWALILSGGLFFTFWLAAMTSFMGIGGNASIEERLFLGVLGAFGVAGATLATGRVVQVGRRVRSTSDRRRAGRGGGSGRLAPGDRSAPAGGSPVAGQTRDTASGETA